MPKKIIVAAGLLLLCRLAWGQRDTLYNKPLRWSTSPFETLPSWVFVASANGHTLGVSDPCLKPEAARRQAVCRAVYLFSMQQANVRLMSDLFATARQSRKSDKLLVMARIEQPPATYACRIVNEHVSKYGECFVEAAVVEQPPADAEVTAELMSSSELMLLCAHDLTDIIEVKLVAQLTASDCVLLSDIKGNRRNLTAVSAINGVKINFPRQGYWYEAGGNRKNTDISSRLNNSFWNAYITSFLKTLLTYNFNEVSVRQLDDTYNDDETTLARERVIADLSIKNIALSVYGNELFAEWQILPIKDVVQ
ncbi:MAG: hypothetical protein LBR06_08500 [Bacteroidales bacterium]|jgi:hypothetical protein|nr:hypothetical protein [Bacteroidales bacterium]